jgi:hypothetical protein
MKGLKDSEEDREVLRLRRNPINISGTNEGLISIDGIIFERNISYREQWSKNGFRPKSNHFILMESETFVHMESHRERVSTAIT